MKLIEYSIKDKVTVIVGVLLIAMFGLIVLFRFPIQLTPNVDIPVVTVETHWLEASPEEVEQEITKRQEEKLKNVQGLKKMTSKSSRGRSEVRLEFNVGYDIDRARLDVSDMLRQVEDYPDDVDEPVIKSSESEESNSITWLILQSDDKDVYVPHFFDFVDDFVIPEFRRIPGVSDVLSFGGQEREVHLQVDIPALSARRLNLTDLSSALQADNINVSAGDLDEGKAEYQVRAVGQFEKLSDIENTVISHQPGGPVYFRDVGRAVFGYTKPVFLVRYKGNPVIAMGMTREVGANVIDVMADIRSTIKRVNSNLLDSKKLHLIQVYDETDYIYSAIGLVRSNLLIGSFLAVVVMFLFLRSGRPTIIVACSIPISIIGTFLALYLLGRNLNVISLAGMAFAVGMVVDSAIVVLENIYRHLQMGKGLFESAHNGAVEVWGAILSSTLTTVAVFLPIVFIEQEAGQLFRDIAIAISSGVLLSMVVSITVIPMLSARLLKKEHVHSGAAFALTKGTSAIGQRIADKITNMVIFITSHRKYKFITIGVLVGASVLGSWALVPPASYLPTGNRNLVFSFLILPPGYSVNESVRVGKQIEDYLRPYWEGEKNPPVEDCFFVGMGDFAFMGLTSRDAEKAGMLIPLAQSTWNNVPGVFGFAFQPSIFGKSVSGRGNTIDIEISGSDIGEVTRAGTVMFGAIAQNKTLGNKIPQPQPANFMLGGPEVQLQPDREKLARAGVSWQQVALTLRTIIDGAKIGDFHDHGKKIDLVLKGNDSIAKHTEDVLQVPIYTSHNGIVPMGNLVNYVSTEAQQEIDHIEEQRSVTLIVEPPKGMALEKAMGIIQNNIIAPLKKQGQISPDLKVHLAGTADKLVDTGRALAGGLLLALVITYLLMSSLFESFLYPLIIMFSVPLAAVGGFLGLRVVHTITGQPLDVLTMLGFVILIGTVVNNAILIIHQSLNFIREGKEPYESLIDSVRSRLRPIFMSTTTTIFGMLPLVIMPGAGSELYRGLGAVLVGGLAVSTIFTLFLIPTLFSMIPEKWIVRSSGVVE